MLEAGWQLRLSPLICPAVDCRPGATGAAFCTSCGTPLVPSQACGSSKSLLPPLWRQRCRRLYGRPWCPRPARGSSANDPWMPVKAAPAAWSPAANAPPPPPPSYVGLCGNSTLNLFSHPGRSSSAAQAAQAGASGRNGACEEHTEGVRCLRRERCGTEHAAEDVCCSGCGWLRPLLPGYKLDRSVFLWAQDGHAMSKLQRFRPCTRW